jgi:hypothetical protein
MISSRRISRLNVAWASAADSPSTSVPSVGVASARLLPTGSVCGLATTRKVPPSVVCSVNGLVVVVSVDSW